MRTRSGRGGRGCKMRREYWGARRLTVLGLGIGGSGLQASSLYPAHPVHVFLAFNNRHHLKQLHDFFLLGIRTNANTISHSGYSSSPGYVPPYEIIL